MVPQSQEQQDIVEQQLPPAESETIPTSEESTVSMPCMPGTSDNASQALRKKRRKKKGVPVTEAELMPRPSFWPLALALALVITLMGLLIHPIVLGIGAVLVFATILGWALERR